jgi:hypothetical protein
MQIGHAILNILDGGQAYVVAVAARKVRSALTQILAECLFVAVVLPSARIIIRVWLHFIVKFHVVKH